MKKTLLFCLTLLTLGASAQSVLKVYPAGGQIVVHNPSTQQTRIQAPTQVSVTFIAGGVNVAYFGTSYTVPFAGFLKKDSTAYGTTFDAARDAWTSALSAAGGTTTAASTTAPATLLARAQRDGRPAALNYSTTTAAINTLSLPLTIGYVQVQRGWMFVPTHVSVSTSIDGIRVRVGLGGMTFAGGQTFSVNGTSTGPVAFQGMLRQGTTTLPVAEGSVIRFDPASNNAGVMIQVLSVPDAASTSTITLDVTYQGFYVWDSAFPDADEYVLGIGDSITEGAGATAGEKTWWGLLQSYFAAQNLPYRFVNRGISGSTAVQHGNPGLLGKGHYSLKKEPKLITWMLGTNDAATGNVAGVAPAVASLNAAIALKRALYPNALMVVILPPVSSNSTYENILSQASTGYRAAYVSAINTANTGITNPLQVIHYTTPGSVGLNDTVHPNDAGHLTMEGQLETLLTANSNALLNAMKNSVTR